MGATRAEVCVLTVRRPMSVSMYTLSDRHDKVEKGVNRTLRLILRRRNCVVSRNRQSVRDRQQASRAGPADG